MKKFLIWILVLISSSFAVAGSNGGYGGPFMRMGLGARALSLGGAGIADDPSAYTMYYNPATVAFLDQRVATLSYRFLSLDRNYNYIGFATKVPPSAGLSIGWIHAGHDDFDAYNLIGQQVDKISNSMNGLYLNVARTFKDRFGIGLSFKYFWETMGDNDFDYTSKGWGFDFGIRYIILDDLVVGASVRDVGSKLKASTTEIFSRGGTTIDRFPVRYGFGAMYVTPLKWLNSYYDFEWSDKQDKRHHLGLEGIHRVGEGKGAKHVAIRVGLNDGNFTTGAGMGFIIYKFVSHLDYAFVPSVVDEGSSHVFSWQVFFN